MKIADFKTIAFDCDGVILNSNKVKTQAFYEAARPYGEENAAALSNYHTQNGGVSRFKKFRWFVESYVIPSEREDAYKQLLNRYAEIVKRELLTCEINSDLIALKKSTPNANWLVVSGGAQVELIELFKARNLERLFEGGIHGSPDSKETIFSREISNNNIKSPALFIGDSKYDFTSSTQHGLSFIFLSQWSEVSNWRQFCDENNVEFIHSLSTLVE